MATCPSGHESASDDFCDVCGVLIGAAPSLGSTRAGGGRRSFGNAGVARGGAPPASLPAVRRPAGRPVLRVVRL